MNTNRPLMSQAEFDEIFASVCNWGRWGPDDERGTLNFITPEHIRQAAGLVRLGRTLSLSLPVNTVTGPDNPHPALHYMIQTHDTPSPLGEPRFALDFFGMDFHGDCHTHGDALSHASYKGKLYNGRDAATVTSQGPSVASIAAYKDGICGRGVLLDMARQRGVKWIEPGESVTADELEAAEKAEGVRLREGDILLFRTGHHRRRLELGPWNNGYDGVGKAGLHPTAMRLLHERRVAAFLPDGDGETIPSRVEGVSYPIHVLQVCAMGLVCGDSLNLEDLAALCEQEKRWQFMVVVAPLYLPRGTGSPYNPIAIF